MQIEPTELESREKEEQLTKGKENKETYMHPVNMHRRKCLPYCNALAYPSFQSVAVIIVSGTSCLGRFAAVSASTHAGNYLADSSRTTVKSTGGSDRQ